MKYTITIVLLLGWLTVFPQSREQGPWWPHPIWGPEDQAGSSNWITPEKILQATKLVTNGKLYELGQIYEAGMPMFGNRTYSLKSIGAPSFGPFGNNNLIGNEEILTAEIGQVGTQFDGPAHIGTQVEFEDGTVHDVYYNGFTGEEIYGPNGFQKLGIENIKPIYTRGILIDIAAVKNLDVLPSEYVVTLEDVKIALSRQGIDENSLKDGDALLFRYGWSKYWNDPVKYNNNPPGIGSEVAQWIVDMNASMIGSDQFGTEVWGEGEDPDVALPVHQTLINHNGIWNLENLDLEELAADKVYEFLFIFTPIRFKGATGSPGRPIAIK